MVTFELRFSEISISIKIEVKTNELIMHKASQDTNSAKPLTLQMKELQIKSNNIQELHLAEQCDLPTLVQNDTHTLVWHGWNRMLANKKTMIAKDN